MEEDRWRKRWVHGRLEFIDWPVPDLVLVGVRFANGRRQAGLSQRRLAERSGVSQSVISRFERGLATGVSAGRIVRIVVAIGPSFPFGFFPHYDDWPIPSIRGSIAQDSAYSVTDSRRRHRRLAT